MLETWFVLAAAALTTVVGMGTGAFVLYRARKGRKLIPRGGIAVGVLWSLPVLLVLGGIATVSSPHFQQSTLTVDTTSGREAERTVAAKTARPPLRALPKPLPSRRKVTEADEISTSDANGAKLPQWVGGGNQREEDTALLAVTSAHFAKVEDAERDAFRQAVDCVDRELEFKNDSPASGPLRLDVLRNHCIRERVVEPVRRQMGSVTAELYRVHLLVELSPKTRGKFRAIAARQVIHNRLWVLGSLVGLATLILATISSYFRLDAWTAGSFRGRLKLAAMSTMCAGGLITWILLPRVS